MWVRIMLLAVLAGVAGGCMMNMELGGNGLGAAATWTGSRPYSPYTPGPGDH